MSESKEHDLQEPQELKTMSVEPRLATIAHIRDLQRQAEAVPCPNPKCRDGCEERTASVSENGVQISSGHTVRVTCSVCKGRGLLQDMEAVNTYHTAVFRFLPYLLNQLEEEITRNKS